MASISIRPSVVPSLLSILLLTSFPDTRASAIETAPTFASDAGTWEPTAPPDPRVGHDGVYDPVRHRLIVVDGYDNAVLSDVWALDLSGSALWTRLVVAGTPPSARWLHTTIYDPVRDRILLFGGWAASPQNNETWALDLSGTPTWHIISTATSPTQRRAHTAIYDPVGDRMIVFGGQGPSGPLNDVWALSLSGTPDWSQLTPVGSAPVARQTHAAAYDPVRNRMLVYGGNSGSTYLSDLWALNLSGTPAWFQLPAGGASPGPRYYHTLNYDPTSDRMVLLGGSASGFPSLYDMTIWSLSLSGPGAPSWSETDGGAGPSPRSDPVAVRDASTDRLILFGGAGRFAPYNDSFALDLSTSMWAPLADGSPDFAGHAAVYDPGRDRMLVLNYDMFVWAYPFETRVWSRLSSYGPPGLTWSGYADDRPDFSLIYDSARARLVVFGGGDRSDVWALDLLQEPPVWSQMFPSGTPPAATSDHAAIYDSMRDRMVVFGGRQGSTLHNEVFALSFSGTPTWTQLSPSGALPPIRRKAVAVYDPVHDRMLIHGGIGFAVIHPPFVESDNLGDLWALDLTGPAWSQISPGTSPSPRSDHTAIYDPVRQRMVVFGGVYRDLAYSRILSAKNDVWSLALSGAPLWTQLAPNGSVPSTRFGHSAMYDPLRDAMIIVEGQSDTFARLDARSLTWGAPQSSVATPMSSGLALDGLRPNPARGPLTVSFRLPDSRAARIDLIDVSGRRVVHAAVTSGPGAHVVTLAHSGEVRPGVYFLRLSHPSGVRVRRCSVIQ